MRVGVSIVLYRGVPALLDAVLAGLAGQSLRPEAVAVHLNEGELDELARVRVPAGLAVRFTATPENLGFSGGHNRLVAGLLAEGLDAVVVHNPDLLLDSGAIEELAEASREHPVALLGPALQLADPADLSAQGLVDTLGIVWTASSRHLDSGQGAPWVVPSGPVREVAGISGACLFLSSRTSEAIVAVGGELFDEDFVAYREDAELGFRAGLLGIPSLLVPAATGLHARNLRGTERGRSQHVDRLGVRNRFLLAFKYGRARPGRGAAPWVRDGLVVLGVVLRERSSWSGLVDAWRRREVMREKGRVVLRAARLTSREAARL